MRIDSKGIPSMRIDSKGIPSMRIDSKGIDPTDRVQEDRFQGIGFCEGKVREIDSVGYGD